MQRLQAFKYELMPTGEQQCQMRRFAGSCRFVFNKALAVQMANHEVGGKFIGYVAMAKQLTEWRHSAETAWLKEAPVHPLQQALKDLEKAYQNFFEKRADFPRFKKKGQGDSIRYPDPKQIKLDQANGRLFLPKLGWVRYRSSRDALGELRNVTVSQTAGKWYVSIQTRREVETPAPRGGMVGIDLGIACFAILSDGTFVAPLNSFKRHETALRKAQQVLSRKVKFSANWKKAKAKVQRLHAHIGNARRDYLHKTTTTISQSHSGTLMLIRRGRPFHYAICVIEDLQVRNMAASAAGTIDAPGRKVRQKSGLNRAILDQGWFEFRRQLDYKLAWNGGHLIAVPPQNTSRTCPRCGHVSADNRRSQAQFLCVNCGFAENADLVGAINILARGMKKLRDEGQDTVDASIGRETAARIACEVSGAVMPPAAGTHRSGSVMARCHG